MGQKTKPKNRHGIGWTAFTTVMCYGYKNSASEKSLQKLPEFKRAAKKAHRRDDMKFASAQ